MDRYFLDQRILERNTARHDDLMDRSRNVIVKAEWFQRPYSIFDQPLCRDDAETEALIYLSQ